MKGTKKLKHQSVYYIVSLRLFAFFANSYSFNSFKDFPIIFSTFSRNYAKSPLELSIVYCNFFYNVLKKKSLFSSCPIDSNDSNYLDFKKKIDKKILVFFMQEKSPQEDHLEDFAQSYFVKFSFRPNLFEMGSL